MAPRGLPRATLEQKIQILDFYHQSNRPQLETVDRYKDEISISTSSFSEWLKNEQDLRSRINAAGTDFSKQSRRKVKFKYEKINRAMDLLVQQKLDRGEPINEPILREHWSIYAHQYGVDDPKRLVGFSHGWLSQFKKRHGLNKKRMSTSSSHDSNTSMSTPTDTYAAAAAAAAAGAAGNKHETYDPGFTSDANTNPGTSVDDQNTGDFSASTASGATYDLMNSQPPSSTSNSYRSNVYSSGSHMGFPGYGLYPQLLQQQLQQHPQHSQLHPQQHSLHPQQHPQQHPQHPQNPQPQPQQHPQQLLHIPHPLSQPLPSQVHPSLSTNSNSQFDYSGSFRPSYDKQRSINNQGMTIPNASTRNPNNTVEPPRSTIPREPETGSQINASDIERFIYMFADRFFHDHAFEYPQTVKIFQDFKTSFFNERILSLRSIQQQQMMQQAAHLHQQRQPQPSQQLLHMTGIDDFFLRSTALHHNQAAQNQQALAAAHESDPDGERSPVLNSNGVIEKR